MGPALLIGADSFVGRHLADHLRAVGTPFVGSRRTPRAGEPACDLLIPEQVERLLRSARPRCVFLCAGLTNRDSADDMFRLHERATGDLLGAVARHCAGAVVVLFGSAAEYGAVAEAALPVTEDTPPRPLSPYGQSKLAQYRVACRLAREHGLRVHVVRPFNVLGPGLGPHHLVPSLIARLRAAKRAGSFGPFPVSNPDATRDWVHARDLADAVVRLATSAPPAPGEVGLFNVATGRETAVLDVAAHLCSLAGEFHAVGGDAARSRTGIDRSCGDSGRLRALTGWEPKTTWQCAVEEMWETP